jgi:O-antigen ligase
MIIKNTSKFLFIYIILATYLISGGFGAFNFVYMFPVALSFMFMQSLYVGRFTIKDIIYKENSFFIIILLYSFTLLIFKYTSDGLIPFYYIFSGFVVVLLMRQQITTTRDIRDVVMMIRIVVYSLIAYYFFQYVLSIDGRVSATYSNENRLASFLVFVSPIFFSLLRSKTNIINNLVIIILILITILLLGSRFNVLAFALIIAVMLFDVIMSMKSRLKIFLISSYILIALLSGSSLINKISQDSAGRTFQEQLDRGGKEGSTAIRIYLFSEGMRVFKESGYMGVGPGGMEVNTPYGTGTVKASLHNHFVNLLATYGLVGFFSFLYLYVVLIKDYYYLSKIFPSSSILYSLKLFLIIFPFSSSSPSDMFSFRPFYFIFGLYFVSIIIYKKMLKEKREKILYSEHD